MPVATIYLGVRMAARAVFKIFFYGIWEYCQWEVSGADVMMKQKK